jgi:hypothetical protein
MPPRVAKVRREKAMLKRLIEPLVRNGEVLALNLARGAILYAMPPAPQTKKDSP